LNRTVIPLYRSREKKMMEVALLGFLTVNGVSGRPKVKIPMVELLNLDMILIVWTTSYKFYKLLLQS
jgi:hypothetical protein